VFRTGFQDIRSEDTEPGQRRKTDPRCGREP